MSITELDNEYVAHSYGRFPVEIEKGKGSILYSTDGKEYIDLTSGIGVTSFGFNDDAWKDAVIEQISKVQHTSNLYYTAPCAELAKLLCEKTGMKKVFFSNSGAEANECAIKAARKYFNDPEKSTIVTLKNSFHGRTLTTLAATGQDHYHELFQPLTPNFESIETIQDLKNIDPATIAAVMIECIQGEGGVVPIDKDFIKQIREYTEQNDILMIIDEVQTGNGRTGKLYSYQHYDIMPDIVSTAKGLAGGLPIGATLLSDKVQNVFAPGDHGSTFGGNPVSCAAALSIIKRLDDDQLKDIERKGNKIKEALQNQPGVTDITGMGLMVGIKTEKEAKEVVNALIEKGVLALTAKDKVRLLPALNIDDETLDKAIEIIKETVC
ncbi:MAG: aspartate aminotransferase family protein [Clostridia bacterium]|nr:aspartate aminotransferase family protein [Clostridia bacterium]